MDKKELLQRLASRRDALGLTGQQVAERAGLTERSIRNALGAQGNPQLSSLLALVDALDMELQLVPKGFGAAVTPAGDAGYRPVGTRIGDALATAHAEGTPAPAPAPRRSPP